MYFTYLVVKTDKGFEVRGSQSGKCYGIFLNEIDAESWADDLEQRVGQ